ncbi:MAG: ATP-binding cassette domain-containing protein [Thaumarchaeota archaeon]|nr:ATP-binding cassette domain-containing protein [Nitrososphaerota archaeon]
MESAVRLRGVVLEYAGKTALRGIDWTVLRGESWAVIGPNGAGKTSLMSIINGYAWPTEGSAEILGNRFGETDLRDLRTQIGMVSAYLDGWIPDDEKVLDLVVSGKYGSTRIWKKPRPSEVRRVASLLEDLGCGDHIQKRVKEISQGERQKVMIARALMADARLLLLDEPCGGLDLGAREQFLDGLTRLAGRGDTAMIYVTHRTEEIPSGFTHALLLKAGKILASGPIADTLTGEKLSSCFDVGVRLETVNGRYYTIVTSGER